MRSSSGGPGRRDPLAVRLTLAMAGALLRLYPRRFRRKYRGPVLDHARDLASALHRRRGGPAVIAAWPAILWDLWPAPSDRRETEPTESPPKKGHRMLDDLFLDLRFAARAMARSPVTTALAVLILALGIGSSVAMFSVVDAVMLRPLPYPEPGRIMSVYVTIPEWLENPSMAPFWDRADWEYGEFLDWRGRQRSFEAASLVERGGATLTGLGSAERVDLGFAGVGLFELFGAAPAAGRFFDGQDEADAAVAVVSHRFWTTRLGGADDALGRALTLDGAPYVVVGVLPAGFEVSGYPMDVWMPIFSNRPGGYFPGNMGDMDHVLRAFGRLRADVSPAMAAEEIGRLLRGINGEDHFSAHTGTVVPRLADETRSVRSPMLLLMGAVLLLLLVACVNVATFLLGQAIDRRQEIAVRSAIGAGGARLVRQHLTESLVRGAVPGGVGIGAAGAGISGLVALAPAYLPRLDTVGIDGRVALFAVGVSLAASIVFGLFPALTAGRVELARTLSEARSGGGTRSRLQAAMVVGEIALATVLLVGAGLLTSSFLRANSIDPGFAREGLLALAPAFDTRDFRDPDGDFDSGAMRARINEVAAQLEALPGVRSVAVAAAPPFSGYSANNGILPEGHQPEEGQFFLGHRRFVEPGYFETLGMPLIEGRYLEPADNRPDSGSSVVVSKSLVDRFWPGESAIGKKLGWWGQESTVVGVVADVRDVSLTDDPRVYFYAANAPFDQAGGWLLVRTEGDAEALMPAVRATMERVAPNVPINRLAPVGDMIAATLDQARFRTRLIAVFAAVAALLSALGLYGVISRAVAARSRELGIRIALGAERRGVVALVLRDGVSLAVVGTILGVGAALAGTRLLDAFLYGVEPSDPTTLVGVVALIALMAVTASLVPSIRASRVDPVTVMRSE